MNSRKDWLHSYDIPKPARITLTTDMETIAPNGTLTKYRCTVHSPSCAAPRITAFIASTADEDEIASPPTPLTDSVTFQRAHSS